jgi:tRNA threonylcarbamoyladenosine biosynthesis protein TsaB
MRILALETTEKIPSIAALDGTHVLRAALLDPARRSAQTLVPGIKQLLADVGWRPADIQLIALTIGPGSFTGLRVGVTTAKTLAYATGAEVLGVGTLDVIARQSSGVAATLWTIMDAQRSQLFTARHRLGNGSYHVDRDPLIEDIDAWLATVRPGEWVSGPVLGRIVERLADGVCVEESSSWAPTAQQVGLLAWERYLAGQRQDMWQLAPHYYRQSAAEEKLAQKQAHQAPKL